MHVFQSICRMWAPGILIAAASVTNAQTSLPEFQKLTLSEQFFSEGACAADINNDGHADIVSGPFWYEGPNFTSVPVRWMPGDARAIVEYSEHFFTFAYDINGDELADLLRVGMPGTSALWYENPGVVDQLWQEHPVLDDVGGESPAFADVTGDETPELVCVHAGAIGYAAPNRNDPTASWTWTAVSTDQGLGRFTHGLGIGDLNGDGRIDLLEARGWWEQPESHAASLSLFTFHAFPFAKSGGAQMFVEDLDGDGDGDVVSVQNAHGWGLSWFERRGTGKDVGFIEHEILSADPSQKLDGLQISQLHAVGMTDVDGDGVRDIVTGKRFYAHNGGDPGAEQLPVLYWFQTVRDGGTVRFVPHLIDRLSGVGTQLEIADVDGDGRDDVVVGNKRGTFVFQRAERPAASRVELADHGHSPGTDVFKENIRSTEPLSPEDERAGFIVPDGFEVELVASEPDIAKPMNLAFDAKGRLWVSSSEEYPYPAPDDRMPRDTIRVLEDTDNDGQYDSNTVFADHLNIPIGLYPFEDGVICFSIPNIWFLRDTDGDGQADQREILYGPFDTTRDTHGMCNSFVRGLDGWIYACHGFNNQSRVAGKDGHTVSLNSGNVFRFKPDGSRIEQFTHGQVNPFGLTFDRYGDWFSADCHTKPITLLIKGGYYNSFGKPHDGLGYVPNVMEHLNGSTGIAGIALGEATGFPAAYQNSAFGGNVVTSRVNRNRLVRNGSSVRAIQEPDILIASDPWFRPVDVQAGPDGALYVADFYNRIIGHYEVPLDHPGRDRIRGRIWRIVSRKSTGRGAPAHGFREARTVPDAAVSLWKQGLVESPDAAIAAASKSDDPVLRVHAFRVLATLLERSADSSAVDVPRAHNVIEAGLADKNLMVRRAAAQAAMSSPAEALIPPLLAALQVTPAVDLHLQHTLKMALRDHLLDDVWFRNLVSSPLSADDQAAVAGLCRAIRTSAAAEYLVAHLPDGLPTGQLVEELRFAAPLVSSESVERIVALARQRFGSDRATQLQLLDGIRVGLERNKGQAIPPVVGEWAIELAAGLLRLPADWRDQVGQEPFFDSELQTLPWSAHQSLANPKDSRPWPMTASRNSADGEMNSRLWSSFALGEQHTGVFRSATFEAPDSLSFFIAGHDGLPNEPLQQQNFIQLRDSRTQAVLHRTSPPRNDTAQQVTWDLGDAPGRRVFLEIVDRDSANAFAWLAVGRFSIPGLNPDDRPADSRLAAAIIERFRLHELHDVLVELLNVSEADSITASAAARALVVETAGANRARAVMLTLADALGDRELEGPLRRQIIDTLVAGPETDPSELLRQIFKVSTATRQELLADILASDSDGAGGLAMLLDAGIASEQLLRNEQLYSKLSAAGSAAERARFQQIRDSLPDESAELLALLLRRRTSFLQSSGQAGQGREVFRRNCAACHRIGSEGGKVGPNLDGIGNRGLDRLLEDTLTPNRNVDVAFRATNILMTDGRVLSGLVQEADDGPLKLINSEGKEQRIAADEIEEQQKTRLSPMPSNVVERLPDAEFRDLMAYLLSLTR